MNPTDIHHLAAAYALDAVDPDERRAFEAHYPTCEVCRADVADHRETLARVAAVSPVAPSADVRSRVLAEIERTRQLSPLLPDGVEDLTERRRRRAFTSAVLAAAAVVVLVVGAAAVWGRMAPTGFGDEVAAVLEDPDSRWIVLEGDTSVGAQGSLRVAWSVSSGRAVVFGDGLAPTPSGRAYELWLIDESGPRPMRLLERTDDGELRSVVDLPGEPLAWGVTVEPVEGSDAPTGDILFLAEV